MLVLFSACKEVDPVCGESFEADKEGEWYIGDFHVHASGASNDTGGDSDVMSIKAKAIERGLDFIVLTDHSNSTGSDVDTTYEDPLLFNMGPEFPYWEAAVNASVEGSFLMIDGNELSPRHTSSSVATGHIGCIPMSLSSFDTSYVFTDRPMGSVTGGEALTQAQEAGCFTVINHAYSPTKWIAYDWTNMSYDAIEVWNGTLGFDGFDMHAYHAWICDLLNGKPTIAIGGSDNHRVNQEAPGVFIDPALGYPSTAIFADGLEWTELMSSVQEGKVRIFEGESSVQINGYNVERCHSQNSAIRYIRIRGSVDAALNNAKVVITRYTGCNDPRPSDTSFPEANGVELLRLALDPGMEFDAYVEIEGESGVYNAFLSGDGTHYYALSEAIVID